MKPDHPIRVFTRAVMALMILATILIVWFVVVAKFIELTLL